MGTFSEINRMRQIATCAAKHGFADLLEHSGVWRLLGRKEKVEPSPEMRRASFARRFRLMLEELGPTFIKLGQILSTRADFLPAELIEELTALQDSAPPISIDVVRQQVRDALGQPLESLFREVDPTPLAAASIAQVHRAVTLDGEAVVLKVQRPNISEQIHSDLNVLRRFAQLFEAVFEETGIYTPTGIVDEFDHAIREELDFLHEANNIRAFGRTHAERSWVRIPNVYDALSSKTVLTLEYLSGAKLREASLDETQRKTLAGRIVETGFRQVFVDGLFHGDPHPGNLLVLEGEVLGLLDFGVVGRISKGMQQTLVVLVLAIALKDADSVARLLYRAGTPDARANLLGFRQDIEAILHQHLPLALGEVNARHLLRDLLDLAVKYKIRVPKEYALLSRAIIAFDGMLRGLAPDLKPLDVVLPYAKELLAGQYDPSKLQGGMMRTLLRLQGLATDLPVQLSQILLDLESGKLTVQVKAEPLERIARGLRSVAAIAFLGLCACGFIVGAFISFAQRPWFYRGIPVLGAFGIAAAAALFGGALSWWILGGKSHKLRLRRWLEHR